jgi:hypothetical protein
LAAIESGARFDAFGHLRSDEAMAARRRVPVPIRSGLAVGSTARAMTVFNSKSGGFS